MNQVESTIEKVISIKDLYKSFGDLQVLKGVNLDLVKGENLAVLGRSGSGKSVLIKLIVGLLKYDSGEIIVFDKNVAEQNKKELDALRLRIGFSFQSSALYDSMSVFGNLAFPLGMNNKNLGKGEIKSAVEATLEAVGLLDKMEQMPAELSGGQRKRIGIARTLIMKPEIMMYDEPTAGLDPITCEEINELMVEVKEKYNTSSIIITHDLTCAKAVADKVALLWEGKFIKTGTFEEVFEKGNKEAESFYHYNFIK